MEKVFESHRLGLLAEAGFGFGRQALSKIAGNLFPNP